jgi:hypothetical protein
VLLELCIAFGVLILLIFGAIVISSASRERVRVSQIVRAAGKAVLRNCSEELRNAGPGIQSCLDESCALVLAHGQQVLGDFKVAVSVYNESDSPAARVAYAEASTSGSKVGAEQSRHTVEIVSDKYSNVLGSNRSVVVIEVFAPAGNLLPKVQSWFSKVDTVIYDGVVM